MKHVVGFLKFLVSVLSGAFTIVATLLFIVVVYLWVACVTVGAYGAQLDSDVEDLVAKAHINMMLELLDPILSAIFKEDKEELVAEIRKDVGV